MASSMGACRSLQRPRAWRAAPNDQIRIFDLRGFAERGLFAIELHGDELQALYAIVVVLKEHRRKERIELRAVGKHALQFYGSPSPAWGSAYSMGVTSLSPIW